MVPSRHIWSPLATRIHRYPWFHLRGNIYCARKTFTKIMTKVLCAVFTLMLTAVKAAPSCYHHHGNSSSLKERSRPSLPTHFGNLHYLGHAGLKPCSCSKLLVHNAVESFVFFMFFRQLGKTSTPSLMVLRWEQHP